MVKILHFADTHIDVAAHGRREPESGLPLRVLDFLKALDTIVDTAISEKVDMVLFAGDAYKDRTPVPTFQREWGKRIRRLSDAGIPTFLLVGNHDLSPALGRAHALQEYETLPVPHVHVLSKPALLTSSELEDLPLQVIALPWLSRSGLMANLEISATDPDEVNDAMEVRISQMLDNWLEEIDPDLPTVFTAHASIQGAKYGGERSVMLGKELVLPGGLVRNPKLDYVALGHIHKAQNLNEDAHPPVIYPGSIERVDFGEAADNKFFVIAEVSKGETKVHWHKLHGRQFIDKAVTLSSLEDVNQQLIDALPAQDDLRDAIVRLTVTYPRDWETDIDEGAVRRYAEPAFEFHFLRRPLMEARLRLPEGQLASSMDHAELLETYWKTMDVDDRDQLNQLAMEIMQDVKEEEAPAGEAGSVVGTAQKDVQAPQAALFEEEE
jgi:DNA repair protein SbcD/Mre11